MSNLLELQFNGLTIANSNGYWIEGLTGLHGIPPRSSISNLTVRDGARVWAQKYNPRYIGVRGALYGDGDNSLTDYFAKFRQLVEAFSIVETAQPLIIQRWDGEQRRILVKVTQTPDAPEDASNVDFNDWSVQLIAEDPFFEDVSETIYTTSLPEFGGFEIPFPIPFAIGGTSTTGFITIDNVGDVARNPVIRITGPITNPRVTNLTTSKTIGVDVTLLGGEYIDIYTDATGPYVLFNGVTNYRAYAVGDIAGFQIVPGTNTLVFGASSTDQSAQLIVTWRNAYNSID